MGAPWSQAATLPSGGAAPGGQVSPDGRLSPGRKVPPGGSAEAASAHEPGREFLAAGYVFGVLAGVVLGVYGVFAVPAGPRLGTALLSVGVAFALVGNVAVALFVRWLVNTRLGATTVLIGWVPTVVWLGASRPEGDLVLQATTTGYLFLGLGALAPMAVAVFGRPRRGLTSLPPR